MTGFILISSSGIHRLVLRFISPPWGEFLIKCSVFWTFSLLLLFGGRESLKKRSVWWLYLINTCLVSDKILHAFGPYSLCWYPCIHQIQNCICGSLEILDLSFLPDSPLDLTNTPKVYCVNCYLCYNNIENVTICYLIQILMLQLESLCCQWWLKKKKSVL